MRPSRIAAINRAHAVRRTARPARDYTLGWRVEPEDAGGLGRPSYRGVTRPCDDRDRLNGNITPTKL